MQPRQQALPRLGSWIWSLSWTLSCFLSSPSVCLPQKGLREEMVSQLLEEAKTSGSEDSAGVLPPCNLNKYRERPCGRLYDRMLEGFQKLQTRSRRRNTAINKACSNFHCGC